MEKIWLPPPKDNKVSVGAELEGTWLLFESTQHRDFFVLLKPSGWVGIQVLTCNLRKKRRKLELKIYFIRLFSSSWASVESWSISKCGKGVLSSWWMKQRKIPDLKAANCFTNLEKKIQMWAELNGFISSFCAAFTPEFLPCWIVSAMVVVLGGIIGRVRWSLLVSASSSWSKEGHHRDSQISTGKEPLLPLTVWVFTSD